MINKNIIISVAVMIGFLLFWDTFVVSKYNASRKPAQTQAVSKLEQNDTPIIKTASPEGFEKNKPAPEPKEIFIKNERNEITFNTQGAQVIRWRVNERDHWLEIFPGDLKHSGQSALLAFPDLVFSVEEMKGDVVRFSARHPQGFLVKKTFELLAEPPFHKLTIELKNLTKDSINVDAALSWTGGIGHRRLGPDFDPKEESLVKSEMRAVGFGARVVSYRPGLIFGRSVDTTIPGPLTWIGVDNLHFLAAIVSKDQSIKDAAVQVARDTLPQIHVPLITTLAAQEGVSWSFLLYVGPKSYTELSKYPYDISKSVNFGMFGPIAKALLRALQFFHTHTGNYGWAIIILTILVQLLVLPLTRKSFAHSIRMKELQPQLKVLQDQYKSDPKRLQIETFNLYKKNGLKFMGMEGCFPILLQMPIFFAFYATMRAAYELRGAPWIFWIHDLGAKDPYYLLPILMGLGMFAQQKLTAVAADPAQARIMMFMPIMFTFMFANLPAGLVLYWFVNSLMSIAIQQFFTWKAKAFVQNSPPGS